MTRLEQTILNSIKKTNQKWNMFSETDQVIIGISGGKDSIALWELLQHLEIETIGVHVTFTEDQPTDFINQYTNNDNIIVIRANIKEKLGKNPCFKCARERRKRILEYAFEKGIRKVAFGHHKDDVVETLLMNMFFSREVSTMLPVQHVFDNQFEIIRPMYLVPEKLLFSYQKERQIQTFKSICGYDRNTKREYFKELLFNIQSTNPKVDVIDNVFSSLKQIKMDFLPEF